MFVSDEAPQALLTPTTPREPSWALRYAQVQLRLFEVAPVTPGTAEDSLLAPRALFADCDLDRIARLLRNSSDPDFIASLIEDTDENITHAAVIGLGLYGRMEHTRELAPLLHRPEQVSPQRVENALWAIWMRAGTTWSNQQLSQAIDEIRTDELETAADRLQTIVNAEPAFAEAHHQLGMVSFLLDRNDTASAAYQTALALNPFHFAAAAGLGHLSASLGKLRSAAEYYEMALRVHPCADGVREALETVQAVRAAFARRQSA